MVEGDDPNIIDLGRERDKRQGAPKKTPRARRHRPYLGFTDGQVTFEFLGDQPPTITQDSDPSLLPDQIPGIPDDVLAMYKTIQGVRDKYELKPPTRRRRSKSLRKLKAKVLQWKPRPK